ncbi:MAG: hypothetical protein ABIO24_02700, partial [Saprospiraceae bacterium]
SPEGYAIYLKNVLDANNSDSAGVNGPPVVQGVALPADLQARFDSLRLIGNTEKDTAGTYRSRGVADFQPSVREWVDLAQQYFLDQISLDDFLAKYQKSLMTNFDGILQQQNLTPDDLKDPSRKPENS